MELRHIQLVLSIQNVPQVTEKPKNVLRVFVKMESKAWHCQVGKDPKPMFTMACFHHLHFTPV